MGRMRFDAQGKLIGVDGLFSESKSEDSSAGEDVKLKKPSDLKFLEEDSRKEDIFDTDYWSLYSRKERLAPLKFSNGKTQEDVVKDIVGLVKNGKKVIFLYGACGTGKSAIALNLARILGSASIVVPVKALQRQYEEDYMNGKHLFKRNGQKMKIAMITGRDNHDSIFFEGKSCADPLLPENIKIIEKNYPRLLEFYHENPFINNDSNPDFEKLRRISVAPANPYWSPILPEEFEMKILSNSKRYKYLGADGRNYVFYHRKNGCSYYDQYLAYLKADVIIFNSAKYLAEMSIGRKPLTEIEIIDEADEFLDSLFQQEELNLTRLRNALRAVYPEGMSAIEQLNKVKELIDLEEKNKRALGIDENEVFHIEETKVKDILKGLVSNPELESEIAIDEMNYGNDALEAARNFSGAYSEVYACYRRDEEGNLYVKLVSTNLAGKFNDLMSKSKAMVFMSGTLHSAEILKKIFGIDEFESVEAETSNFKNIEIVRTGKEIDCKYSNFTSKRYSRKDYLMALKACFERDIKPSLVHVFAFQDLPSVEEKSEWALEGVMTSEQLLMSQKEDKTGKSVSLFKSGFSDRLFTTKCSRGVDFPGEICNSIVFTKYPNPNVSDIFWKILKKTHPDHYWEFYKDKARREFLQRIYRALRSKDDHVYILSPDIRVLEAVGKMQRGTF